MLSGLLQAIDDGPQLTLCHLQPPAATGETCAPELASQRSGYVLFRQR